MEPSEAVGEVGTPPAVPTSSGAPSASPLRCPHVDPATATNLGDALLFAACHAAVLLCHAKPFSDEQKSVGPELALLLQAVAAPPAGASSLRALHTALHAWTEGHRTWLTRAPVASETQLHERAGALRRELQAAGDGAAVGADAAAPGLVSAWDGAFAAHCPFACDSAAALAEHKAECAFRPVRCPNAGCEAVAAAASLASHDAACGFKPVLCVQGCGDLVPRREQAAHCAGSCAYKPITCAFKHLGCDAPITAGGREAHMSAACHVHLELLAAYVSGLGREAEAAASAVAQLQSALAKGGAVAAAVAAAAGAAVAAEAKADAAAREAADARREARASREDTRRLGQEVAALKAQHAQLVAALKAR